MTETWGYQQPLAPTHHQSSSLPAGFPKGLRVLVVDDDSLCLKVVEQMLRKCDYTATTCTNGMGALQLLRERPADFDLVLSDCFMPDMDGFKLLEMVGLEMDLPVIMMSSNGETNTVLRGVTHGAVDFLIKPVRIEELRNLWQHVVRRRRDLVKDLDSEEHSQEGREENAQAAELSRKRKDTASMPGDLERALKEEEEGNASKKPRVTWSVEMHQQFVAAVNQLGIDKAVPKKILEIMNVEGLTRENVASHLQKYRLYLKRTSGMAPGRSGKQGGAAAAHHPAANGSGHHGPAGAAAAAGGGAGTPSPAPAAPAGSSMPNGAAAGGGGNHMVSAASSGALATAGSMGAGAAAHTGSMLPTAPLPGPGPAPSSSGVGGAVAAAAAPSPNPVLGTSPTQLGSGSAPGAGLLIPGGPGSSSGAGTAAAGVHPPGPCPTPTPQPIPSPDPLGSYPGSMAGMQHNPMTTMGMMGGPPGLNPLLGMGHLNHLNPMSLPNPLGMPNPLGLLPGLPGGGQVPGGLPPLPGLPGLGPPGLPGMGHMGMGPGMGFMPGMGMPGMGLGGNGMMPGANGMMAGMMAGLSGLQGPGLQQQQPNGLGGHGGMGLQGPAGMMGGGPGLQGMLHHHHSPGQSHHQHSMQQPFPGQQGMEHTMGGGLGMGGLGGGGMQQGAIGSNGSGLGQLDGPSLVTATSMSGSGAGSGGGNVALRMGGLDLGELDAPLPALPEFLPDNDNPAADLLDVDLDGGFGDMDAKFGIQPHIGGDNGAAGRGGGLNTGAANNGLEGGGMVKDEQGMDDVDLLNYLL